MECFFCVVDWQKLRISQSEVKNPVTQFQGTPVCARHARDVWDFEIDKWKQQINESGGN